MYIFLFVWKSRDKELLFHLQVTTYCVNKLLKCTNTTSEILVMYSCNSTILNMFCMYLCYAYCLFISVYLSYVNGWHSISRLYSNLCKKKFALILTKINLILTVDIYCQSKTQFAIKNSWIQSNSSLFFLEALSITKKSKMA